MKNLIKWIELKEIGDQRGKLVALENNKSIPFNVARIYYIFGMSPTIPRGFHAHKKTIQLAICINGSCEILMDNGNVKESVLLNNPSKGLIIDVMQWHEMKNFSQDCVLLVLASELYDESDYIRDYEEFMKAIEHENSSVE